MSFHPLCANYMRDVEFVRGLSPAEGGAYLSSKCNPSARVSAKQGLSRDPRAALEAVPIAY